MKKGFPTPLLLLLILSAILLPGCAKHYYGPITIPMEYQVERPSTTEKENAEKRLHELQNVDQPPYRIGADDRYQIVVFEYPELEVKSVRVTPDGYISIPLVGSIKIGGLTIEEAQNLLAQKLKSQIKNPQVSLIALEVTGFTYTIAGQINSPGRYPVAVGRTRLADSVAEAKGFVQGLLHGNTVPLADLDKAYLSRNGELLPVDFTKAIMQGDALNNIPLLNGDYIYIPATMQSRVALLGEVNRQTYIGYNEGLTLVNALTFCSGLKETHSSDVKIIRGSLHNPLVYTVNIDKMLLGEIQDFKLAPDDIVYFPKDKISSWNVLVQKVLPTMQGLSMLAGPFGNPANLYLVE